MRDGHIQLVSFVRRLEELTSRAQCVVYVLQHADTEDKLRLEQDYSTGLECYELTGLPECKKDGSE